MSTPDDFIESVKRDFDQKEYRPELVLVAYTNEQVLFVKSARSGVWNLPQEGVEKGEKPRDAFLRGWLEELCHINIPRGAQIEEEAKTWAEKEYFGESPEYRIIHEKEAETPGRSRSGFSKGKKYYFVAARLVKLDIVGLSDKVCPEEISDIELINKTDAHILMVNSGVAIRKRRIVSDALAKLKPVKKKSNEVIESTR